VNRAGLKKALLVGALVLVVLLSGAMVFLSRGFSARDKPGALETFIARRVRHLATPRMAVNMPNPLKESPLALAEARDHFADHCALCHANDGSGKTAISEGLYPPAPDLREENTQGLTDGEIFYIIKNGIRFTGMPGWGGEDEENWKLVLFIRHLPALSEAELKLMKEVNEPKH